MAITQTMIYDIKKLVSEQQTPQEKVNTLQQIQQYCQKMIAVIADRANNPFIEVIVDPQSDVAPESPSENSDKSSTEDTNV